MYIPIERNLYTYQTKLIYLSINRYIGFPGVGKCALFMHEEECFIEGCFVVLWQCNNACVIV